MSGSPDFTLTLAGAYKRRWPSGQTDIIAESDLAVFETAKLPRLVVCPHKENERSIAVLRRLGFSVMPDWLEPDCVICALQHPDDGRGAIEL